jgi:hypothetical protein
MLRKNILNYRAGNSITRSEYLGLNYLENGIQLFITEFLSITTPLYLFKYILFLLEDYSDTHECYETELKSQVYETILKHKEIILKNTKKITSIEKLMEIINIFDLTINELKSVILDIIKTLN